MLDPTLPFALFDDNLDALGDLLLSELVDSVRCNHPDEIAQTIERIELARQQGLWIALAISYEFGLALEPHLIHLLPPGAPLFRAWIFKSGHRQSSATTSKMLDDVCAQLEPDEQYSGVAGLTRTISQTDYCNAVERIRDYIDAGDCYQVNFTFPIHAETYGASSALYRRLRKSQPVRYGAFVNDTDGAILSRSPELFVEQKGTRLTCKPMKGTAPKTSDPDLLATSEKNRAENIMIVDLIRNDLGRLVPSGGVRVERLCEIEAYPSVWQMTSTVAAEPTQADLATTLGALFPCGSITGAPKIRAMEIIAELETEPRGLYCGALGWMAPDGDFRLNVPIRTLEVDRAQKVRMGLGSGIVTDSVAQEEWEECLLKGRFLSSLTPEFGLIETLRCDPACDSPLPLLDRHLERLADSASHFNISVDLDTVRRALVDTASGINTLHRIRLVLDGNGKFTIAATPHADFAQGERPTVVISPKSVTSTNKLLKHKTTIRNAYDRELSQATANGHFDALFFNERGELAEGARSNIFLDLGHAQLVTPPITSGALNGVFRRKLLDETQAREEVLTSSHLTNARAIYAANALRGLFRVKLVGAHG